MRPLLAHHDRPPFSGRPSLTGHCGHGWTCSLPHPVAIGPKAEVRSLMHGYGGIELLLRRGVLFRLL